MLTRIRNRIARAISPGPFARPRAMQRAIPRPSADVLARARLASRIDEDDPIGSIYVISDAFTEWFDGLPASAKRIARRSLRDAHPGDVVEFLAFAIGADLPFDPD